MKLPENILAVAGIKPDYMGFIFYRQSKRFIDGLTPSFVKDLPAEIKKTGVFVNEELNRVAEMALLYGLNAVQLHGTEPVKYCMALKGLLVDTGIEIIKAFGVNETFDFAKLGAYVSSVDHFLFDTQTPDHGGSGIAFNWEVLDNYRLDKSYFLSGGIGLGSIAALKDITDTRLYGIDVNSKFELTPGLKDIDRLIDFKKQL